MNSAPFVPEDPDRVLSAYAESCRLRFIKWPGACDPSFAISDPQKWVSNCRDDALRAIRDGRDTWERITRVAMNHDDSVA